MDYKKKIDSLIESEKERTSSENANAHYQEVHKKRFTTTFAMCKRLVPSEEVQVLDIGRSVFTNLLSTHYKNVTSLGFPLGTTKNEGIGSESKEASHIIFDLNDSPDFGKWPKPDRKFDLIIYAETIEHIYTAPEFSLLMLRSLLSEKGKLIITTPNAAAFHKRVRMALGRNPYERIRYFAKNPGHFREYTMREMKDMCTSCEFRVKETHYHRYNNINYFSSLGAFKYLFMLPFEAIPSMKDSMSVVVERMD